MRSNGRRPRSPSCMTGASASSTGSTHPRQAVWIDRSAARSWSRSASSSAGRRTCSLPAARRCRPRPTSTTSGRGSSALAHGRRAAAAILAGVRRCGDEVIRCQRPGVKGQEFVAVVVLVTMVLVGAVLLAGQSMHAGSVGLIYAAAVFAVASVLLPAIARRLRSRADDDLLFGSDSIEDLEPDWLAADLAGEWDELEPV